MSDVMRSNHYIDSKNQEQMARIVLAKIYRETGEIQDAENELAIARELFDTTGEQDKLARIKLEMGLVELEKDNRENAITLISEAHSMFNKTGMKYWANICKKIMHEL